MHFSKLDTYSLEAIFRNMTRARKANEDFTHDCRHHGSLKHHAIRVDKDARVTEMTIAQCHIDNNCAIALNKMLPHFPELTYLFLFSSTFTDLSARTAADVLAGDSKLTTVLWQCSDINSECLYAMAAALKTNTRLKKFGLTNSRVTEDCEGALAAVVRALAGHAALTELDLNNCRFVAKRTAAALAKLVAECPALKVLGLNFVNLAGRFRDVGRAIGRSASIEEMQLQFCNLESEDVQGIADGLRNNTSLKTLLLNGNKIRVREGAFAAAVAAHPSLERIQLENCTVNDDEAFLLSVALRRSKTLTYMFLDNNPLTDACAPDFVAAVRHSPSLQALHLYQIPFSDDSKQSLMQVAAARNIAPVSFLPNVRFDWRRDECAVFFGEGEFWKKFDRVRERLILERFIQQHIRIPVALRDNVDVINHIKLFL